MGQRDKAAWAKLHAVAHREDDGVGPQHGRARGEARHAVEGDDRGARAADAHDAGEADHDLDARKCYCQGQSVRRGEGGRVASDQKAGRRCLLWGASIYIAIHIYSVNQNSAA